MADAYPEASGQSTIGALLRKIQEDKNASPLLTPPGTEVSSPIRNLVQPPLSQVESPESAHIFSVKPEIVTPPSSEGVTTPLAGVPSAVVSPVAPRVVAPPPMAPLPPGPAPSAPAARPNQSVPSQPAAAPQPKPVLQLASRIMPFVTPRRQGVGGAPILGQQQPNKRMIA